MPKSENQKLKILYILHYLEKNSHEDHPVRASELIEMLKNTPQGIICDRKTIYSDIRALQDYGVDIITIPGKNGGYYIGMRNFEPSELKLLIDAVQSSKYLTEKKSRELIKKLCAQCNEHDAAFMSRNVMVSGRVKSMNETILYSVDSIQEAIAKCKKISFRYFDWNLKGNRVYREKEYLASPYGLCQDNENCYLLALSERHGITSYRVDRMADITVTDEPRALCPEMTGKGLIEHANRRFQMFAGDAVQVRIRFHNKLLNGFFDKFGRDFMLIPDGPDHFIVTVPVAVSPMFLSWVIGFGADARILSPQSVIDQCRQLCLDAMSQY